MGNFEFLIGLFGGLALFLFGMDLLARALKRVTGDQMKTVLSRLTGNRLVGVTFGAVVTAIVQSSSVTTVLIVGFISAGVMTLSQSVAVIMGANIGSTFTAQILAFNVSAMALPLVSIGVLLSMAARSRVWQEYGTVILGLGMVFYGMGVMSGAMVPLRSNEGFIAFMATLQNPLLAAAVGAGFTALIQSSAATTGILIVLASQGLVGLEPAIGVALGANVGTCATALLAAIGKPREAVRAAVVHTLFNISGVLIWVAFIPELAGLSRWISPAELGPGGALAAAALVPRQLANAHTLFNVANTLIFVGFTSQISRMVEWIVPEKPAFLEPDFQPRYLDRHLFETPAIALEAAKNEIGRIGDLVVQMVEKSMPVALQGPRMKLEDLAERDLAVDALHQAVIEYLGKISGTRLSDAQSEQLLRLVSVVNDLEQIGDLVSRSLVVSSMKRLDEGVIVSPGTRAVILRFHGKVMEAISGAVQAFASEDAERARQVRAMKGALRDLNREIALYSLERLTAQEPRRVKTYAREIELIEILDDIFRLARRIARALLGEDELQIPV